MSDDKKKKTVKKTVKKATKKAVKKTTAKKAVKKTAKKAVKKTVKKPVIPQTVLNKKPKKLSYVSLRAMPALQQRIISSLFIVPLFIGAIYFGGVAFFALMAFILAVSFHEWTLMSARSKNPSKFAFIGSVYLAIGLGSFLLMRLLPIDQAGIWTLAFMVMIWASDTGAFFSGRLIGGKKLCPSISPGKTWAGFIGGILFASLVGLAFHDMFGFFTSRELSIFIGAAIAIAGQGGDLVISKFKRVVDVKDTGNIIPGHGGVLDRVDSILLAAPVYLICLFVLVEKTSAVLLQWQ